MQCSFRDVPASAAGEGILEGEEELPFRLPPAHKASSSSSLSSSTYPLSCSILVVTPLSNFRRPGFGWVLRQVVSVNFLCDRLLPISSFASIPETSNIVRLGLVDTCGSSRVTCAPFHTTRINDDCCFLLFRVVLSLLPPSSLPRPLSSSSILNPEAIVDHFTVQAGAHPFCAVTSSAGYLGYSALAGRPPECQEGTLPIGVVRLDLEVGEDILASVFLQGSAGLL